MEYLDRIYGPQEINEPVLLDLIASAAVQRLNGVLQHGISGLIGVTSPTTRFEHSLGAMLLVRRLGAGLEEQIAALLHDVSHTAFSHVIDYVFNGHNSQSYHEEKKEWYMAGSDLPAVLQRHGCDWRVFLAEENYPLLEQPAPALCADRLDYFLRDSRSLGLASLADVQRALAHLAAPGGLIIVDDLDTARWLANTYLAADQASWANFREVGLYELAARAIRAGLRLGAINEADLWTTDAQVWAKLQACPVESVRQEMARVSPATRFAWDEAQPDFYVSTKLRTIDPHVLVSGRLRRLSEVDEPFARARQEYLRSKAGRWPMRVLS